jgi:DNA-directed RNA polymerase specialized sigma24 family protein
MSVRMKGLTWWDRDCDDRGRPIRTDVRLAAHEIWEEACRRTYSVLADGAQAADLMESAVAEVSRYMDQHSRAVCSCKMNPLLMVAFSRALQRRAGKLRRIESVGASMELDKRTACGNWSQQVDARLDLDRIVRRLSERSSVVLALRWAGYDWKEIAQLLGTSVAVVRNGFWREIQQLRRSLDGQRRSPPRRAKCA